VDRDCWIASGYAADASGRWCPVGSARAKRYSLIGAFIRAGGRAKDLVEAGRAHLTPALYTKLSSTDPDLSYDEALAIIDHLSSRLDRDAQPAPRRSGFVRRPGPEVTGRVEDARNVETSRKKNS
jgi:hypothetical protein